MSRQPWMKFYPADWQSDHLLRSCSIAARGLWIELLCVMQKADPVGHLLVNGKPPAPALLSILCGVPTKDINRLLDELRSAGVFDDVGGVIVSRRMVRDVERAERDKANGRKGGNPMVKAGVNPQVKGEDKAHIPEARIQKTLGASAPSEPAAPARFEEFWGVYPKREGANPKKPTRESFVRAVKRGADPDQIIAAARHLAARHPKPSPFIPRATTWLNEERYADEGAALATESVDEAKWSRRLQVCRASRDWPVIEYGPMPNAPGCRVPGHLVEANDGVGWARQRELVA